MKSVFLFCVLFFNGLVCAGEDVRQLHYIKGTFENIVNSRPVYDHLERNVQSNSTLVKSFLSDMEHDIKERKKKITDDWCQPGMPRCTTCMLVAGSVMSPAALATGIMWQQFLLVAAGLFGTGCFLPVAGISMGISYDDWKRYHSYEVTVREWRKGLFPRSSFTPSYQAMNME